VEKGCDDLPPLMEHCGLNDSDTEEEDEDEVRRPYAIKAVSPPVVSVPQCLVQPVDCCADFEEYRASTQDYDASNRTVAPAPMEYEDDRKPAAKPDTTINLCEADRMKIALKKNKGQIKGMGGDVLEAEYTTKKL
jgi:hypothetical protein